MGSILYLCCEKTSFKTIATFFEDNKLWKALSGKEQHTVFTVETPTTYLENVSCKKTLEKDSCLKELKTENQSHDR